ncbi:MAG: 50S ribosomal protein L22 [Dehalococcoidales bacterium]|nr:50S ribosomal protein L22 [Dehalococcoidales bacterium]
MEVTATSKYVRMSPRKVRLVLDAIKGRQAQQALAMLRFMPQAAAGPVWRALHSAVANAENNYALSAEDLYVRSAAADKGPTLKRGRPKARGRYGPILKRSSHITVVVGEKEG